MKSMDNLHNGLKVELGGKNDTFSTVRKSVLKLVELQSLVEKCCKIRNI